MSTLNQLLPRRITVTPKVEMKVWIWIGFFKELNKAIRIDEIKEAIDNLKPGKFHIEDGILKEYFIEFLYYFFLYYITFLIVF